MVSSIGGMGGPGTEGPDPVMTPGVEAVKGPEPDVSQLVEPDYEKMIVELSSWRASRGAGDEHLPPDHPGQREEARRRQLAWAKASAARDAASESFPTHPRSWEPTAATDLRAANAAGLEALAAKFTSGGEMHARLTQLGTEAEELARVYSNSTDTGSVFRPGIFKEASDAAKAWNDVAQSVAQRLSPLAGLSDSLGTALLLMAKLARTTEQDLAEVVSADVTSALEDSLPSAGASMAGPSSFEGTGSVTPSGS